MSSWYIEKGPCGDVVISSRIRLARNVSKYPFPIKMNKEQEAAVINDVRNATDIFSQPDKKLYYLDMDDINLIERLTFVEKHLISPNFANSDKKRGVLIDQEEKVSIMINEEDHLRIQCMESGLQLERALKNCIEIDDGIESQMEYAFDTNYGYLTSCPTNVGTGLRASTMLHLPALAMTGHIKGILEACSKLGIAVRGLYGENTEASGNLFQISNQVTLGYSENEIINHINGVINQIAEQEVALRMELYKQNSYRLEDRIFRSRGLFENAVIMNTEESMKLLSDIRFGIELGIINDIKTETINEIMVSIQPANIQKQNGRILTQEERDVKRTEKIKELLKRR